VGCSAVQSRPGTTGRALRPQGSGSLNSQTNPPPHASKVSSSPSAVRCAELRCTCRCVMRWAAALACWHAEVPVCTQLQTQEATAGQSRSSGSGRPPQ